MELIAIKMIKSLIIDYNSYWNSPNNNEKLKIELITIRND